jgi:hypothetical protein
VELKGSEALKLPALSKSERKTGTASCYAARRGVLSNAIRDMPVAVVVLGNKPRQARNSTTAASGPCLLADGPCTLFPAPRPCEVVNQVWG